MSNSPAAAVIPPRSLIIENLDYSYLIEQEQKSFLSLSDINLTVPKGEFVCLVGQSGCGKSTLLNIIAGLLPAETGTVRFDAEPIRGPGLNRAVVFQHASLLPWRTVRGNVRYGMEMQRLLSPAVMDERV
ncbi:ATP-binding cassette domain-containing protein, partial [Ferrovibrio terrae]|uniref:ATP-binding cassette domain-containing protein n=1 Tax=Ferrovibrio terrae TaxID=2594003 RepID=UPI0031382B65